MKETAAERLSRSEIAELLTRYEGLRLLPAVGTDAVHFGHADLSRKRT